MDRQQATPHQLGGLGNAVSSPSVIRGVVPTAQSFSSIYSTQDGLSWHYNVVNCGLPCSYWGAKTPVLPLRTPGVLNRQLSKQPNTSSTVELKTHQQCTFEQRQCLLKEPHNMMTSLLFEAWPSQITCIKWTLESHNIHKQQSQTSLNNSPSLLLWFIVIANLKHMFEISMA